RQHLGRVARLSVPPHARELRPGGARGGRLGAHRRRRFGPGPSELARHGRPSPRHDGRALGARRFAPRAALPRGEARGAARERLTGASAWVSRLLVGRGRARARARLLRVQLEPGAYDEKIYAPGIGIVSERSLTGPSE